MDREIDCLGIIVSDCFDVIIAGGSISGLLAAREIAALGNGSVAVFEEDSEIGTPEHCGGLVSVDGLKDLRLIPGANVIQNKIRRAKVFSRSQSFTFDTVGQKVLALDRRMLDKQVALQAQKMGVEIKTRNSVRSLLGKNQAADNKEQDPTRVIKTSEGEYNYKFLIDARGASSLISNERGGVLQSAQYEIYASWIDKETVEIQFDADKYPGFFAWIIPTGAGTGKVGVAGKGINAANALKSYLDSKREKYSVIRQVFAPIWISGPIENFVRGLYTVVVGDAAGQTKPTTAGGIYTCGMGGILAGRAVYQAIEKDDINILLDYKKSWLSMFHDEFERMLLFRRVMERLDNKALDQLFIAISRTKLEDISRTGNFDFHSAALRKLFESPEGIRILRIFLGSEIRRLLG
jgi:flavin-dependent dehydrogenase